LLLFTFALLLVFASVPLFLMTWYARGSDGRWSIEQALFAVLMYVLAALLVAVGVWAAVLEPIRKRVVQLEGAHSREK
jgi:hypothetical protein